ncbi:MAG TPA: molybdopterin dinucleotide binding domain-containing protein, partial [Gemmatimonadales bacterium]|nr:molybdopterin dinucleotide binding domain-containing protein [Gemmatimonadales bacterium]
DTRQFPEVLLSMAMAQQLGGALAVSFPFQSYPEMLQDAMRKRIGSSKGVDFDAVWVELLRHGGLFDAKPDRNKGRDTGYRWNRGATPPVPGEPRFSGDGKQFPLHLQIYPSTAFYDGRGAVLPWLQQLPDPMTTVVWDSWIEINPKTAAELGIGFGDLVEVTSPQGSLRLPAVIYPGIRPDMVAIPMGQGHRGGGRYAKGRGANPLALVAATIAGEKPRPAWNATRVRLTRISEKGELVTAGHPQGSFSGELIEI